jgi:MoCo/4Fe-4S cofactor protein with predicted Tat translocation signal
MSSMNDQNDLQLSAVSSRQATCAHADSRQPTADGPATGREYWRSLDDLADTPQFREFMHREFPAGATELLNSDDRRQFLKIMGASMALAGLGMTGCRRWPEEKIMPFAHRPEGRMPGVPVHYASGMELGGVGYGLLVTTYDGRPIKIEGNPEHPATRGATNAIMQASTLNLYDPDRSQSPRHNGQRTSWNNFVEWAKEHFDDLEGRRGRRLAFLTEATSSPSFERMKQKLQQRFPAANWYEYEPLVNDNVRRGSILAFGDPYRTHYHLSKAKTIVSLDADFLLTHPDAIRMAREFAQGRRADDPAKSMNRLYVCEGTFSLTGANADHRYTMRSADVAVVAARLAGKLLGGNMSAARNAAAQFDDANVSTPFIDQIVEELEANRGASAIIVGSHQPAEVHMLAHLINEALGNVGETVTYTGQPDGVNHTESLRTLAQEIDGGGVETLVIIGGNPAYDAPADLDFAAKLNAITEYGVIVHLGEYYDETAEHATWHVNRAHYLEAFGDSRAYDGTLTLSQPLIEPLFGGKSAIELMAVLAGENETGSFDLVRSTFREATGLTDADRAWRRALHDGLLSGSAFAAVRPSIRRNDAARHINTLHDRWANSRGEYEIVFAQDPKLYDGRFANNGWLQELPESLTKLTWDNAAIMNPTTAKNLGVKQGDMVTLTVGDRSLDVAVYLLPGHGLESITLWLGYGRRFRGRICTDAGFDANTLRTTDAMGFTPATVSKTRGSYVLATTQDHYAIDTVGGRGKQQRVPSIFRETTRDTYQKYAEQGKPEYPFRYPPDLHVMHRLSVWEETMPFHRQTGFEGAAHAWAMSIDLSACIGCSACVVACQAENNIPIVGKDQVNRYREMHWLRVDRYFRGGTDERPDAIALQPVPCMHCENAPCEQVCPVAATVHDEEGLNVMVYNRCIGTRYCSNNCPYKVRRFNYFDFHRRRPVRETGLMHVERDYFEKPQAMAHPLHQLQFNPEVTVRSRGVMEKCTFCVQRISRAKIDARNSVRKAATATGASVNDRIKVEDGAVTTACAQACPTEAIVFGDLLDTDSRIHKLFNHHDRAYEMLEELNTKPRVKYQGKLRNPRNHTV